jgi:hypothetical protein
MVLFTGCSSKFSPGSNSNNEPTIEQQGTQMQTGSWTVSENSTAADSSSNVSDSNSADSSTNSGEQTAVNTNKEEPPKVKALYLTGWTVGSTARVEHYVELAKNTEINSYVVDIKDDDGYVGYESQIPEVKENGTWKKKYNVDSVLKAFHDGNVHIIGRIVCFKDPVYSIKRPDLAIKSVGGGLWKDNNKKTWLNPYDKGTWDYNISIAKEAVTKGFDEIQFDYVRFPSDGKKNAMDFGGIGTEECVALERKKSIPAARARTAALVIPICNRLVALRRAAALASFAGTVGFPKSSPNKFVSDNLSPCFTSHSPRS